MKINDNDISKILAELPEMELPEGFHDEVMAKIKAEAKKPRVKKKSRTIWYIGSFATAAAAAAVIMLTFSDFGQNNWSTEGFADAAPMTESANQAAGLVPEAAMAMDMDMEQFEADFALEAPIARMDAQHLGEFENRVWTQVVTTSVSHFPDHLPTDLLHFDLSEHFAFTFEIFIAVDDINHAQEAIYNLGEPINETPFGITLQPASEDLETVFTALYALGIVEEYRITSTNTALLSDLRRVDRILEEANTITVTLLHNAP